jgi:hypothetical protein
LNIPRIEFEIETKKFTANLDARELGKGRLEIKQYLSPELSEIDKIVKEIIKKK